MAKVLIVDDSPAQINALKKLVEDWGHETLTAQNGDEALQIARQEQPNVILMDIVMPGMSGCDLAERLTTDWPTLKVLYMSGYSANVIAHHGILKEGVQFLSKPFSRETLAAKLREILER